VEMCASVRECPSSGKSDDDVVRALAGIAQRVSVSDPAVEVWRVPLVGSAAGLERLAVLLSRDEHARAARFQFTGDRNRFIAGRGMLRVLLGNYVDAAPSAIAFASNPHGKPALADAALGVHFNLAHAGDIAIFAFARNRIPGIDIESLDHAVDHDALAQRFFSARECAELQSLPHAARNRAFLTCWTCKEAVAKAIGRGLSLPLDQIEVTVGANPPRVLHMAHGDAREWTLHPVDAGSAYVATLAVHDAPCPAR